MNNRIAKLREQSLKAVNRISSERANLIIDFYKSDIAQMVSTPVKRALAFRTFWIVLHVVTCCAIIAGNGRTLGVW